MLFRVGRAHLDESAGRELEALVRDERIESEPIRTTPADAGQRRSQHVELTAEVRRLADDADDRAERETMMADMESCSSGWPE